MKTFQNSNLCLNDRIICWNLDNKAIFSREMDVFKCLENKTISNELCFTNVEISLQFEEPPTGNNVGLVTTFVILLVNIPLLRYIFNHGCHIFINKLIAMDCCLCICNIAFIFPFFEPHTCFVPIFLFFTNVLNRLLSISIGLYRYVFVVRTTWVQTKFQRHVFSALIFGMLVLVSCSLTGFCIFYRTEYYNYMGNAFNIL